MGWLRALYGHLKQRLDKQLKVLIKNSSWVFLANAFKTVLSFVKSILIARGLGADLYGNYVVIIAFVMTVQEFFNLNIGTAIIKFGAEFRSEERLDKLVALTKASLLFCVATGGLSVLTVTGLVWFVYDTFVSVPGMHGYILAYAVAAGMSLPTSVSSALLRLFYKFRLNALVQMSVALIDILAVFLVLALFPKQLGPFIIAMIIVKFLEGSVINTAAAWELLPSFKKHFGTRISLIREDLKPIRKFVLSNSGSRTLKTLMDRGDVLLLGALSSTIQVGYYDIAKKLAYTVLRLTDPLANSIYPQMAMLTAEKRVRELKGLMLRLSGGLLVFGLLIYVPVFFGSEWLIVRMYGNEFVEAVAPFLVHLVTAVLSMVFFWSLPMIFSLGKVTERLKIYFASLSIGSVIAYFAAPLYGALGVAVVSFIVKTLIIISQLYVVFYELRGKEFNL